MQQHGKQLVKFSGMLEVERSLLFLLRCNLFTEETLFNALEKTTMPIEMERTLDCGHRNVYDSMMQAIGIVEGSIFF